MNGIRTALVSAAVMGTGFLCLGHSASTSYLLAEATPEGVQIRLEIPLRDLEERVELDSNRDGKLTWGELRSRTGEIRSWLDPQWGLSAGGRDVPCEFVRIRVSEPAGEPHAVLEYSVPALPGNESVRLWYHALFSGDPLHRCLVRWRGLSPEKSAPDVTTVLSPGHTEMSLGPGISPSETVSSWVREGVHHIWTGYDHLLFLLALLLPAVVRRTPAGWDSVPSFRQALREVFKVVTAFTLAHSITLALAATRALVLPSRWVETAIAGSIAIAALANLGPTRRADAAARGWRVPWKLAFAFGLIHGFGFASVLEGLGLPHGQLAVSLLKFNVGVELGQLACVLVFLPLAFGLRGTRFYRLGALPVGSGLILLAAGGWMLDRSLGLGWMPF